MTEINPMEHKTCECGKKDSYAWFKWNEKGDFWKCRECGVMIRGIK